MKRGRLLGALLLFLLPLFAWVGIAQAQSFRSGDTATVPKDQVIDSALWAAGRTIDVAGTVEGDVFCAGQSVSISGTVKGDVICAAQTINITGTVEGDVRLAGQTVTIGGQVQQSATVAGSTFTLTGEAKIGQDLSAGATDVILNGEVGRDLSSGASKLVINSKIGRDVQAESANVVLQSNAQIGGDLAYTSARDAEIQDGAQIAGSTNRSEPEKKPESDTVLVSGFGFMLYIVASLMILSLALVFLYPSALREATDLALDNPVRIFIVGLVAAFAVPALLIVLMVTVLGIPLALLLLGIWFLLLWLAGPVFSFYLGRLILQKRSTNPFLAMALGSFLVLVLFFIPILGWILWIFAMLMGTGMLLTELMRRTPRPQYQLAADTKRPAAHPKNKRV